ncbi:hypothetical protein KGM_209535 [Danaus plexippus plexippus]|uniref:Uncharacterized protein n=1 Tax=Danaus plexippus plexippus TaxID=278856 RepID=A0A212F5I5_DANPL|nr:hypothetical protein KGM_209535 [Danaus plexippus plexippus]
MDELKYLLEVIFCNFRSSCVPSPDKPTSSLPTNISQFPKNDNGTYLETPYNYNNNLYNFNQNDNGLYNIQNGFNSNGFVNYSDNEVNSLLGVDPITDTDAVTPEQLNLLRLAAQEIGGAQFTSPNKYDEKFYNFFEPNQRNSLPDSNVFSNNYNRPNSLSLDLNYNTNYDTPFNAQRFPSNGFLKDQPDSTSDLLTYLNQMSISGDRPRDDILLNDFKMPDGNSSFQSDEYKMQDDRNKMFYNNRNFQTPNKNFSSDFFLNDVVPMPDRNMNRNYDFSNQSVSGMGFKPNGFHPQNEFVQRREVSQMLPRESYQGNGNGERVNFDVGRENAQQNLLRQQEIARQMNIIMRNRPPPNPLNVDVSFIHDPPFNLGIGTLLGPSPPVAPPVLQSPLLDMPLLAPFYAMRNIRNTAPSSSILHARLDACYEQWRQLERERKRTEARLALAYPGRAVSSSNSIPVPRLPPCPTRVDRLTVDMLREHTKVLTLMGKMETLRASVCVAQNKRPNKPDENKITVLKRGQDNVTDKEDNFDPATWRDDVRNLSEIAPHSEVESAMLAWRNAVAAVQAARRREVNIAHLRYPRNDRDRDPILQLSDAVKQLCVCARRARCAMWCDLTLTVALAPHSALQSEHSPTIPAPSTSSPKQSSQEIPTTSASSKPVTNEQSEDKQETQPTEDQKDDKNKTNDKDKNLRRTQNYRKLNHRNDFYKNQRYDNRFVNKHPYHYLAGSIN